MAAQTCALLELLLAVGARPDHIGLARLAEKGNSLQDDICLILEIEQTWISDTRGCPGSSISFPPPQCAPSNLGFHQDHLLLLGLLGLLLLGEDEGHTKSILPSKKQCQPEN